MSRRINQKSIDLIKSFESLFLESYKDDVGIWTIGWGTTSTKAGGHNDGTIVPGMKINEAKAEEFLRNDLRYFEGVVEKLVDVDLTDDEFGALVSFAYNCGEGNLKRSTLLRKLNAGDKGGASKEFIRWNRGDGRILNGLTRRRASEERLFKGEDDPIIASVADLKEMGYTVV